MKEIVEKYKVTQSEKLTCTAFSFADPAFNGFIVNVFHNGTVQFKGGFCADLKSRWKT
jgi:hypothetical protein